jgi:hypothetical protein
MIVVWSCLCSREQREVLLVPDPEHHSGAVAVSGLGDWATASTATSGPSRGQVPCHCSRRACTSKWLCRWHQWDRCWYRSDRCNASASTSCSSTLAPWKCCRGGAVWQWGLRDSEAWTAGPRCGPPPESEQRWKQSVLLWLTRADWRSSGATATTPCTTCPWPIKWNLPRNSYLLFLVPSGNGH